MGLILTKRKSQGLKSHDFLSSYGTICHHPSRLSCFHHHNLLIPCDVNFRLIGMLLAFTSSRASIRGNVHYRRREVPVIIHKKGDFGGAGDRFSVGEFFLALITLVRCGADLRCCHGEDGVGTSVRLKIELGLISSCVFVSLAFFPILLLVLLPNTAFH